MLGFFWLWVSLHNTIDGVHLSQRGKGSLAQVLAGLTERDQVRFEGKRNKARLPRDKTWA